MKKKGQCARCDGPRDAKGRYCRTCHAQYMRDWRAEQKEKNVVVSREYLQNLEHAINTGIISQDDAAALHALERGDNNGKEITGEGEI